MKFIRKFDQFRRDCSCELECENCGEKEIDTSAYDDRDFWDNVVPSFPCKKCGKSSKDMGILPVDVATKYADYEVI